MSERITGPAPDEKHGLKTFEGVYRPALLTMLAVMLYLRSGWIVGQVGLLGAILLILLTFLISGSAALSFASLATNVRTGAGGTLHLLTQALGFEPGGSIAVPLFLGQALSAALYVFGFVEAWELLFPHHPPMLVAYCLLLVIAGAALFFARVALRLQVVVMVVVLLALGLIALGSTGAGGPRTLYTPQLWRTIESSGFWILFAIFFPAGTGMMVATGGSDSLAHPRRSIPRGTIAAVATAFFVYLLMAIWYSVVASPETLRSNYLTVVERAAWGELALAAILASTLWAALHAMVVAPRLLQTLSEYGVVSRASFLARVTKNGDPRNAALATGALVAAALALGSLDRVAYLITLVFLFTYLTIHLVVLLEQGLGMVSFRPLFRIPVWVPMAGFAGCLVVLLVISPVFTLIALSLLTVHYMHLSRQHLVEPTEAVRGGMLASLADAAVRLTDRTPLEGNGRAWKPDLLVPVESRQQLEGTLRLLRQIVAPTGSLRIIGVRRLREPPPAARKPTSGMADRDLFVPRAVRDVPEQQAAREEPDDQLDLATASELLHGLAPYATYAVVEAASLVKGVEMTASVLRNGRFGPSIIFGHAHRYDQERLQGLADVAVANAMGFSFLYLHPDSGLGHERAVNVWVPDQGPDWPIGPRLDNHDLALLLAMQVSRSWDGRISLSTIVTEPEEIPGAKAYLQEVIFQARLNVYSDYWVGHGRFMERVVDAAPADLHVLSVPRDVDLSFLKAVVRLTGSSCLFVRDSGNENALA